MVSVVTGAGVGLSNTSKELAGQAGELGQSAFGRAGERVTVNAATGNLVIQNQDEFLVGIGEDVNLVRTYNSLGAWDGDNGDQWRLGYYRRVSGLTGGTGVNTVGSTIKRLDADGFESTFSWDGSKYVGKDGAGAYDSLSFASASNTWTWTDGDSGVTETYVLSPTAGTYRLDRVTDPEGHSVRVSYDGNGLITTIATWASGGSAALETVTLSYDTATKRLTQVASSYRNDGGQQLTRTRERYEYDTAGRLSLVVTDLSPEDNSVADGRLYWVRYGYDANGRVNSITQLDGSALSIVYDASGRVGSYTDALGRTTTLTYDAAARKTTLLDALGQSSVLGYDTSNRLIEISGAIAGGGTLKQGLGYDGHGNLTTVTNPANQTTTHAYDTVTGNHIRSTDAAGNVVEKAYDSANRQISETRYTVADPDGPAGAGTASGALTTRYVYGSGAQRRLLFTVSPEGRVTRHDYGPSGLRTTSLTYTSVLYSGTVDATELTTWSNNLSLADKALVEKRDYAYNVRGQVQTITSYATAQVGTSVAYGSPSVEQFTYDAFGRLLQTTNGAGNVTSHVYDGLNRVVLTQDGTKAVTLTQYDDAGNRTTVRQPVDGSARIQVFDAAGQLVSSTEGMGQLQPFNRTFNSTTHDYSGLTMPASGYAVGSNGWLALSTGDTPAAGERVIYGDRLHRFDSGVKYQSWVTFPSFATGQLFAVGAANATNTRFHRALFRDGQLFAQWMNAANQLQEVQLSSAGQPLSTANRYYVEVETHGGGTVLYVHTGDRATGFIHHATLTDWNTARLRVSAFTGPGRAAVVMNILSMREDRHNSQAGAVFFDQSFGANGGTAGVSGWPTVNSLFTRTQDGLRVETRQAGLTNAEQILLGDAVYGSADSGQSAQVTMRAELTTSAAAAGRNFRIGVQNTGTGAAARALTARFLGGELYAEYRNPADGNWVQVKLSDAVSKPLKNGQAYVVEAHAKASGGGAMLYVYEKGTSRTAPGSFSYTLNQDVWTSQRFVISAIGDQAATSAVTVVHRIQETYSPVTGAGGIRTRYAYDKLGRLRQVIDASDKRSHILYDGANRKVADIDATGRMTEYVYDAGGRLVQTIEYANRVSATARASLFDANGVPTTVGVGSVRPAADAANDRVNTRYYDAAGRPVGTQDATGHVTKTVYDGASRVTETVAYNTPTAVVRLDVSAGNTTSTPPAMGTVAGDTANDRRIRHFHGNDGLLLATLDAEGYLVENEYDAAGRRIAQTAYHTATAVGLRTSGTLAALRPAKDLKDRREIWIYDLKGRVAGALSAEGHLTTYTYDGADRVVSTVRYRDTARLTVTAPAGTVTYQAATGLTVASLIPASGVNETVTRTYNGRGQLENESVAGKLGEQPIVTRYEYDGNGRVKYAIRDHHPADRRATQYTYHGDGQVYNEFLPDGTSRRHIEDVNGRRISTTDERGNATIFYYDDAGRLVYSILRTALGGEVKETLYNTFGEVETTITHANRLSVVDAAAMAGGTITTTVTSKINALADAARDNKVTTLRTKRGEIQLAIDALGHRSDYSYNAFGQLSQSLVDMGDGRRTRTDLQYDRRGSQLWSSVDPLGLNARTGTEYDAFGRITATIDANNNRRTIAYLKNDGTADSGRKVVVTDALPGSHTTVYDFMDRVVATTDRNGHTTKFVHDAVNRTVTMTTPENVVTVTEHNRFGEVVKVTDGNQKSTSYTYDKLGRLLTTTDANGNVTQNVYDNAGNKTKVTTGLKSNGASAPTDDGSAVVVDITYDAANRVLTRQVDPTLKLTTSYEYDGQGRAVKMTDANGIVTSYVFDAKGQLKDQIVDDVTGGLKLRTSYTYDAQGRTLTVIEAAGTAAAKKTEYRYDVAGRRTHEIVDPDGLKLTTTYEYDKFGNVLLKRDALANPTRYVYDARGRVKWTIDASGGVTENIYDGEGRLTGVKRYNKRIGENNAVRVWYQAGSNSSLSRHLGSFAAGDVVTATVRFKAEGTVSGAMFLGDAGGPDPYDNSKYTIQYGTRDADGWQTMQLTHTMSHADEMWVYLYGDRDGASAQVGNSVLFDDVTVTSTQRGTVLQEGFEAVAVHAAWSASGPAAQTVRVDSNLAPAALSDTQITTAVGALAGGGDQLTQLVYDKDGRLVYQVDAEGGVIRSTYDGAGRVVESKRYATPQTGAWTIGRVPVEDAAKDQTTYTVYDAAGRARYSVDALDYVTETVYDRGGRVVATKRYAKMITRPTTMSEANVQSAVNARLDPANDRIEYFAYDAAGRQRFKVDAEGYATELQLDAMGRVTQTLTHGAKLSYSSPPTLAQLSAAVLTRSTFDADLQGFAGDAGVWEAGRIRLYSEPVTGGGWATMRSPRDLQPGAAVKFNLQPMDLQSSLHAGLDHRTNALHGRLLALLKTDGHVYAQVVDANGNWSENDLGTYVPGQSYTVEITTHATGGTLYFYAAGASRESGYIYRTGSVMKWSPFCVMFAAQRHASTPGSARAYVDNVEEIDAAITSNRYDAAGRLTHAVDADGVVTAYAYDAQGRVTDTTVAFGRPEASTTHRVYDVAGRVIEETRAYQTAAASTTRYRYDANGRVIAKIDPRGVAESQTGGYTAAQQAATLDRHATRYGYDAVGQRTTVIDPLGGVTITAYDAFGNAARIIDARGGVTYVHFDKLNRAVQSVDAERYLTVNRYDAFGNVWQTAKYASQVQRPSEGAVSVIATGATPPASGAYLVENASLTRTTTMQFTRRNEQRQSVDAENHTEAATFNAFGEADTRTNKLASGVAYFKYDRLGRVVEETLPALSRRADNSLAAVINQYAFDARGHRIRTIEAFGLPEQRTTQFVYDANGREVREIGETIAVYHNDTGHGTATPTQSTRYDARGNVIEKVDANGRRVLCFYDAADRRVAELAEVRREGAQALGQLKNWTYDADGHALSASVFGDLVALPAQPGGLPPQPVSASNARTTWFQYDALGRQTVEQVKSITVGAFQADPDSFNLFEADLQTQKQYDAAGNVVKETDRRGHSAYTYYDAIGRKVLHVDRELYVTRWVYANDTVTETRYATTAPIAPQTTTDPASLIPTNSPDDRIKLVRMDRLGRAVEEQVLNVKHGVLTDAAGGTYGEQIAAAVTRRTFNGLGNVLEVTDADGHVTRNGYDRLGRLTSVSSSYFTGHQGTSVLQRKSIEYNGLGLVSRETLWDSNDSTTSGDRVTLYGYNKQGQRILVSDPSTAIDQLFDAAGNMTYSLRVVTDADGARRRQGELVRYDGLGREELRRDVWVALDGAGNPTGSWTSENVREIRYNAFGDVTGKRLNGGGAQQTWQEWAEFDAAGRMVKSNSAKGVAKFFVYDQNGNATLTFESTGAVDFSRPDFGLDQARNAGADKALSISIYDRRDKVIGHVQPNFTVQDVLARVDRQTNDVVGGAMYLGGTTSVTPSTTLPTASTGAPTALGHVHATAIPAGTSLAVNLNVTVTPVITNTYYGSFTHHSGTYKGTINSLNVPLPNLGWYGEGDYQVDYSDTSGVTASVRVGPNSTTAAITLPTPGSGSYTITIHKWLDANVRLTLVQGTGSLPAYGTWSGSSAPESTGPVYFNLTPPAQWQFHLAGQPANAASMSFEIQAVGSSQWSPRTATQMGVGSSKVPGWFVVDGASLSAGSYRFRYITYDTNGTKVNEAQGQIEVSATNAAILQSADATGAGSVTGIGDNGTAINVSAARALKVSQTAGVTLTGTMAGRTEQYVTSKSWTTIPGSSGYYRFYASSLTLAMPQLAELEPATLYTEFIGRDGNGAVIPTRSGTVAASATSVTIAINSVVEGAYTINVYADVAGTRKLVAQGNGSIPKGATWSTGTNNEPGTVIGTPAPTNKSTPALTLALPKQILFKTPADNSYQFDRVDFGYRLAGTHGAYNFVMLNSRTILGSFTDPKTIVLDIASAGMADNQSYEYVMIASGIRSGSEREVKTRQLGTIYTGSVPSVNTMTQPMANGGFTVMRQVGSDRYLDFYDLGRNASGATAATSATMRFRASGSTGAWTNAFALSDHSVVAKGKFSWGWTGMSSGSYDFVVETRDNVGNVVSRVAGAADLTAAPKVTAFRLYENQPSTVTIGQQPSSAQSMVVSWTYKDKNATTVDPSSTTGSVTLSRQGDQFVWNAGALVPDVLGNYLYEYTIEAFDGPAGTGQQVNKATGQIWLGVNAKRASELQPERSATTLSFTPPAGMPSGVGMRLLYRVRAADNASATAVDTQLGVTTRPYVEAIPAPQLVNGRFVWSSKSLSRGTVDVYDYVAEYLDTSGSSIVRTTGTFRVGDQAPAGIVQLRATYDLSNAQGIYISRKQGYNAFGEIRFEEDGRGNRKDLSYNTLGLLTERLDPEAAVTAANGFIASQRASTRQLYSLGGRLVRSTDANGNDTTFGYAAHGVSADGNGALLAWEHHEDGGRKTLDYDEFGLLRRQTNELGHATTFDYDLAGRLQTMTRPMRATGSLGALSSAPKQSYEYDQFDRRIATTNELGYRTRTYYDAQGRVSKTIDAENLVTAISYAYDATIKGVGGVQVGGWRKTTANAAGTSSQRSLVEDIEYFGRNTYRWDLGNHSFTYTYDHAGHLSTQTGSSGQNIAYEYYANGYIKTLRDHGLGVETSYGYDRDGNRTSESYRSIVSPLRPVAEVYQSASVEYDAMNRVRAVRSTGGAFLADLQYEYDGTGNVMHIRADYKDGDQGNVRVQDLWYRYDSMNRFIVTQGTLKFSGGLTDRSQLTSAADTRAVVERGANGVWLEYDLASQRKVAIYGDGTAASQPNQSYLGYSNDGHREDYAYTTDGYLEQIKINNVERATRKNDAAGRVTEVVQYDGSHNWIDTRTTQYLRDNQADVVTVNKGSGDERTFSSTKYHYDRGTLTSTVQSNWFWADGTQREGSTITHGYTYEWWDSARQKKVDVTGRQPDSDGWTPGAVEFKYDVNGHTKSVTDKVGIGVGIRELSYVTDAQGQILRRDENVSSQLHRWRQYYYLDGKRIGDVSNDGPSREDYVQAMSKQQDRRTTEERYRDWKPIYSADFDQNYEPITPDNPGPASTSYTVRQGDTLRGIAQALWGDGQMWYLIAEANGLFGDEALHEGRVLVIPNKVTNIHHNATTRRVYNPGEALGDVMPTLPAPPPPREACGGIGMVIMVVIAVVVTAWTGGMAAGLFGNTLLGTMASGAVGAAAGSIASQGFAVAVGMQDEINWNAVGKSALQGAIVPALGDVGGAMGLKGGWASAVNAAAATGLGMAIRGDWSWRQVIASAVGAGLGGGQPAPGATLGLGDVAQRVAANWAATRISQRKSDPRGAFLQTLGQLAGDYIATEFDLRQAGYRFAGGKPIPTAAVPTQGHGPWSSSDYRNGSDVQSDPRPRPAFSDEPLTDDGDDGPPLPRTADGRYILPNGKIVSGGSLTVGPMTVVGTPESTPTPSDKRSLYPGEAGPVVPGSGGFVLHGLPRHTRHPVPGVPKWARPADGSGLSYTFDSRGQAFWRTGDGVVMSVPAPYAMPQLSQLQASALWTGIKEGGAGLPEGVAQGISDLWHGRVTMDSLLTGMFESSPVGVLAAMADDNYRVAGGRVVGTGFSLATSAAVQYGFVPVAGQVLTRALNYVDGLGPDVRGNPFLADQALWTGSSAPREVGGPIVLTARDPIDLAGQERLNVRDPDTNKFRPGEAGAAAEFENYIGGTLERAARGSRSDFVVTSGPYAGKSVDFKITPDSFQAAKLMNQHFEKNLPKLMEGVAEHAKIVDFIPMDTRVLSATNKFLLSQAVHRLPADLQLRIILIK